MSMRRSGLRHQWPPLTTALPTLPPAGETRGCLWSPGIWETPLGGKEGRRCSHESPYQLRKVRRIQKEKLNHLLNTTRPLGTGFWVYSQVVFTQGPCSWPLGRCASLCLTCQNSPAGVIVSDHFIYSYRVFKNI